MQRNDIKTNKTDKIDEDNKKTKLAESTNQSFRCHMTINTA